MVDDNTSEEFVEMVEDESPKKPSTLSGIPLIQWSDLSNITLLRHGTGTSVYSATLEKSDLHLPQNVIIKTPREGLRAQAIHDVVSGLSIVRALLRHPSKYTKPQIPLHMMPARPPARSSPSAFLCFRRRWSSSRRHTFCSTSDTRISYICTARGPSSSATRPSCTMS
jgi:hypothetical protein